MERKVFFGVVLAILLLWARAVGASSDAPVPVSPGGEEAVSLIENGCPTFSWAPVPGATAQELVVYAADADRPLPDEIEPALLISLPGRTSSWTPSWEQCLQPGRTYAWTVRAKADGEAGNWPEPLLFRVLPEPSDEEVRAAVEVLRRVEASGLPFPSSALNDAEGEPGRTIAPNGSNGPVSEQVVEESPGLSVDSDGNVVGNAFIHWCGPSSTETFYGDGDGDNYPWELDPVQACVSPSGYVEYAGTYDCDDLRAHRNTECICDPFNPSLDCHSPPAPRCEPSWSGVGGFGVCSDVPIGAGGQGDSCTATEDCGVGYICEPIFFESCVQWCRVLGDDCPEGTRCNPGFAPGYYIGTTEWGICVDD